MKRIDSHHHFWDRSVEAFDYAWQESPGMEKICRNFLPADLQPLISGAGIDATVLVQTQHHLAENRWALKLAEENEFICGVVGWVDLADARCEEQLAEFLDHPKFAGVRHVVQDEPDEDFIIHPNVAAGLAVLEKAAVPYDLLFYARHLRHATTVAGRYPDLPLVIDHLSKPPIRLGEIEPWRRQIQAASKFQNVFCKLSGMVTEADWQNWSIDDLRPYVEVVLEAFGPERLMFGSDWPVCELAADYRQVVQVTQELLSPLSSHEQAQVFGQTAQQFYGLNP